MEWHIRRIDWKKKNSDEFSKYFATIKNFNWYFCLLLGHFCLHDCVHILLHIIGMVVLHFVPSFCFAAQNCHYIMSSFNENVAVAHLKVHPIELVEYPCCVVFSPRWWLIFYQLILSLPLYYDITNLVCDTSICYSVHIFILEQILFGWKQFSRKFKITFRFPKKLDPSSLFIWRNL